MIQWLTLAATFICMAGSAWLAVRLFRHDRKLTAHNMAGLMMIVCFAFVWLFLAEVIPELGASDYREILFPWIVAAGFLTTFWQYFHER